MFAFSVVLALSSSLHAIAQTTPSQPAPASQSQPAAATPTVPPYQSQPAPVLPAAPPVQNQPIAPPTEQPPATTTPAIPTVRTPASSDTRNQPATIPAYGPAKKADPDQFPSLGVYQEQKKKKAVDQPESPINPQTTSGQQQNTPNEPIRTLPTPQKGPPAIIESDTPGAKPTASNPIADFFAISPYGSSKSLTREVHKRQDHLGSAYINIDSWVYPEVSRLYSMDFLDTAFVSLRPYTRRSLLHMLQESAPKILASDNEQAKDILAALLHELVAEDVADPSQRGLVYGNHALYTRLMGVSGQTLRDSFHLGQTLVNDYGRPYQEGFNNITGFETINEYSRFSLHVRGEYQFSPSGPGYSAALSSQLLALDGQTYNPAVHYRTIPNGDQPRTSRFTLQEAYLSFHLLGHEISGGKTDQWLGPGLGGAAAWSNNAEDIYSFRINRVEPLSIPFLSRVIGPIRYDFVYGSLKGHTAPNVDYTDSIIVAFKPTRNVDIAFQRTIIFGGKGHEPVTLHTFLNGFFSVSDTTSSLKFSREDPGARFSNFSFAWRLPFIRKYATLYTDSEAHDDVTPPSAPRRASYRVGVFLSQIPKVQKLSFRVEAVNFDPPVIPSQGGQFEYVETVQRDGYTNQGYIFGDANGREAKGGNAWLTYHLSGNEWIEFQYRNKKTPKDFIQGGTTQNVYTASIVKRLTPDIELNAWIQYERWKAPIYLTGLRQDTIATAQFTWYPKLRKANIDSYRK